MKPIYGTGPKKLRVIPLNKWNPPSPPKIANPNTEGEHIVKLYFKGQIYEIGRHYYGLCTQKMFFYGLPWDEVVDR